MANITLKLSGAIVVGGQVIKSGQLIEVSMEEARSLLNRGKAEIATVPKPAKKPESEVK